MKKAILFTVTFIFLLMSGIALADTLHFTWDANHESDLVGYYMYRSLISGNYGNFGGEGGLNWIGTIICSHDDSTCTVFTDSTVDYNETYYWVVTAFDSEGLESGPSNEVTWATGDPPWVNTPPSAPGSLRLSTE